MIKRKKQRVSLIAFVLSCLFITGCQTTPSETQTAEEYGVMKITNSDKSVSTSYSATIRGKQE